LKINGNVSRLDQLFPSLLLGIHPKSKEIKKTRASLLNLKITSVHLFPLIIVALISLIVKIRLLMSDIKENTF